MRIRTTIAVLLITSLSGCEWLHEITAPATPVTAQAPAKSQSASLPVVNEHSPCASGVAIELIKRQEFEAAYQRLDAELTATPPSELGAKARYCSQLTRSLLLLLAGSPYQDMERAQAVFQQLREDEEMAKYLDAPAFDRVAFNELILSQQQLQKLSEENAILRADLQKKEEALLKLKELTIGTQ